MGCNSSKLDDEEAVRLCKDRKKFIKQAVEYRVRFATGHIAYIQSLKRVSAALRDYIEGGVDHHQDPRELLDSYTKKSNPNSRVTTISPKCFSAPRTIQHEVKPCVKISYYRPEGTNSYVSVEQRPPLSPETVQVQSYNNTSSSSSMLYNNSYNGIDGFFTMQSPSSSNPFPYYSYNSPSNRRNNRVPPSPTQAAAQWDFFWNPFSSLDYYGYPTTRSSLDQSLNLSDEIDINGLSHVREAEGIPDLEEETDGHEEIDSINRDHQYHHQQQRPHGREEISRKIPRDLEEVTVEDVDDDDDDDDDNEDDKETECFEDECKDYVQEEEENDNTTVGRAGSSSRVTELSRTPESQKIKVHRHETAVGERESREEEEAPGFTVYVNRRPISMEEVIKDLETQFMMVCKSAKHVSSLLEARSAQYLATSNEITPMKMLNPVALFRSGSFRSSSSRCLVPSSLGFREDAEEVEDEAHESSSDSLSAESCMISGSHPSTLDRLYAWEKRLYGEVRAGERIRLAYEKKCKQLRKQDVKGEDPSSMEKTRSTIRDLHTQIMVAIHSISAISKRIESLRDEELHPQLIDLVHGLSSMWKVMAECHRTQRRTLDDAKMMLAGTPSRFRRKSRRRDSNSSSMGANYYPSSVGDPNRLARSAANLEAEIRNWKSCFETWVSSQRSYVHALTGWVMRCAPDAAAAKSPFSPEQFQSIPSSPLLLSSIRGVPPIFGMCIQWSRLIDGLREAPVLDGLDFFAAGMGSICAHQMIEDSSSSYKMRVQSVGGSKRYHGSMDVIEHGKGDDDVDKMTPEKMAEVGLRVLCAGMSVAVSSLTEYAIGSAHGYAELIHGKSQSTTLSQQPSLVRPPVAEQLPPALQQQSAPQPQPQPPPQTKPKPPVQELSRPPQQPHPRRQQLPQSQPPPQQVLSRPPPRQQESPSQQSSLQSRQPPRQQHERSQRPRPETSQQVRPRRLRSESSQQERPRRPEPSPQERPRRLRPESSHQELSRRPRPGPSRQTSPRI